MKITRPENWTPDENTIDFHEKRKIMIIFLLLLLMIASIIVGVIIGPFGITAKNVFLVIGNRLQLFGDSRVVDSLQQTIVWDIRLPRILLAAGVGTALAFSGGVFQGCFKNPLVEPYILGASSGAAFGAALAIVLPTFALSLQCSAFFFSLVAVLGAYSLAKVQGETPIVTLILAGVIIGALFSAFLSILKYIAPDAALREIVFWLMGGFYYAVWKDVQLVLPAVFLITVLMMFLSWKLNIISMGDEEARTLGINPEIYKLLFILLATLMTALSVSMVGIIAWVGLMMPHAARILLGPDHRFMLPAAGLMGGIYMVLCDTIARNITNTEVPVGIIASILGAPYLIYLLRSKGKVVFGG